MKIRRSAGESAKNRFLERSRVRREIGERVTFSILRLRPERMLSW